MCGSHVLPLGGQGSGRFWSRAGPGNPCRCHQHMGRRPAMVPRRSHGVSPAGLCDGRLLDPTGCRLVLRLPHPSLPDLASPADTAESNQGSFPSKPPLRLGYNDKVRGKGHLSPLGKPHGRARPSEELMSVEAALPASPAAAPTCPGSVSRSLSRRTECMRADKRAYLRQFS